MHLAGAAAYTLSKYNTNYIYLLHCFFEVSISATGLHQKKMVPVLPVPVMLGTGRTSTSFFWRRPL